eukprot:COSAG02_NODE_8358_length_2599_cov_2.253600_5_plen_213_part_00
MNGTCLPSAGSVATCTFVERGAGTCDASQGSKATIFTYSMGASPTDDGGLLKSIACRTGGIWAAVPDSTHDSLKQSLQGFYAFWSAALAHSTATNLVWSEPYTYSGTGFLGTTVSAPAFDRSDPANPRFIGVVGMDFLVSLMERVVGGDMDLARPQVLQMLMSRSRANSCPTRPIDGCSLQSLRQGSGGSNAMCPDECTAFSELAAVGACLP